MPQHKNDMLLVAAPRASMAEVVSGGTFEDFQELAPQLRVLYRTGHNNSELLLYTAHTDPHHYT